MKRLICLLLSAFFLNACSVNNRINITDHEEHGLKSIRLIQSPEVRAQKEENGLSASSFKDVSILYLLDEKIAVRPQMTLEIDLATKVKASEAYGAVIMILDNEDIPLSFYGSGTDSLPMSSDLSSREKFKQKYLIPENLWISILHSKKISYQLPMGEEGFVNIFFNQKEKDKLSEFVRMAIRQRDLRFPAVPEGQVKW